MYPFNSVVALQASQPDIQDSIVWWQPRPLRQRMQDKVIDLSLNMNFACTITLKAKTKCWGGRYTAWETGVDNAGFLPSAANVSELESARAVAIASSTGFGGIGAHAGHYILHTCVLTDQLKIVCWGGNTHIRNTSQFYDFALPLKNEPVKVLKVGQDIDCIQYQKSGVWCKGNGLDGTAFNAQQKLPKNFDWDKPYHLTPSGIEEEGRYP